MLQCVAKFKGSGKCLGVKASVLRLRLRLKLARLPEPNWTFRKPQGVQWLAESATVR